MSYEHPELQICVDVQIQPMVLAVELSTGGTLDIGIEALNVVHVADEPYTGPTVFTPTQSEQTIPVAGKTALADIVINPIPQNYGLITWNGATLTVS